MAGVTDRTVLRDFEELLAKGVLEKVGVTGRATQYVIRRETRHKPDKPDILLGERETRHKPDNQDASQAKAKPIAKGAGKARKPKPRRQRRKGGKKP